MVREKIDFTDRELYTICLALETHLCSRDTWFGPKGAKEFNRVVKKIKANAMKRKDPKSILHPLVQFRDEE